MRLELKLHMKLEYSLSVCLFELRIIIYKLHKVHRCHKVRSGGGGGGRLEGVVQFSNRLDFGGSILKM